MKEDNQEQCLFFPHPKGEYEITDMLEEIKPSPFSDEVLIALIKYCNYFECKYKELHKTMVDYENNVKSKK